MYTVVAVKIRNLPSVFHTPLNFTLDILGGGGALIVMSSVVTGHKQFNLTTKKFSLK